MRPLESLRDYLCFIPSVIVLVVVICTFLVVEFVATRRAHR